MKTKRYNIIYKTTNLINNKYYIGAHSTNKLSDKYLGSGIIINKAIKKYGYKNFKFEILEYCNNKEEMFLRESEIVNQSVLDDKLCYNIKVGGNYSSGTKGRIEVRNKLINELSFIFPKDFNPEIYERIGFTKGKVVVKDTDNNIFLISKTDPRYLSGELVSNLKGKIIAKDKNNHIIQIDKNDPRYLSGELFGHTKGRSVVKDKNGKTFQVDSNDIRIKTGELVHIQTGNKHTIETINKMRLSQKEIVWVHNTIERKNIKIKKSLLQEYLNNGWLRGLKREYFN